MLQYTRLAKDYEIQYKPQIEAYMAARMMRDAAYVDMVKGRLSEGNFDEYRRLAGEVEARNVENRMAVLYESRRFLAASVTEDVARESQIVRYSTGIAASIAGIEGKGPVSVSSVEQARDILSKMTSRSESDARVGYSDSVVLTDGLYRTAGVDDIQRNIFFEGKPVGWALAGVNEEKGSYQEKYLLNMAVSQHDSGEGWSPVDGKPLSRDYGYGCLEFSDEKEMLAFYERNREEIDYRNRRSSLIDISYDRYGLQEAQALMAAMPVRMNGFVGRGSSWVLCPWKDVESDPWYIFEHSPEERERLKVRDGEPFGEWLRRNSLSSYDFDVKVWFYQKYAGRWDELSRLFYNMQGSSPMNREEAYITGRKVAELVSDRKEGFVMIDLLKDVSVSKVMPYLDGVTDGIAEKEGRQVTAGSPLTVDEARETWQKAWGDYVESGRQMQQSEDYYNSLLTQSILDRYKDVELNLSDEDNRLLDDLFEARKVFLADEDRDYDRFQDFISSDAPYYAIHGDVREAVSSIFWHEDPLTYRQRDLVLAAMRREPGYLLDELKSSAWDLGYEDIASCFMEAADYPTLLSQSEVDVIHRISRVSDTADMTDYEHDVYRDVMDAYNNVKEGKAVTVRQRDLLVAYAMSICPDSGTANMRYLAAEMGIEESVLSDALSHPVRDQKEEEHLEDTLVNHDMLLQRIADTVGVGHRYDFRNLDDMFDDRSLSLSAMPDRMTGIDFVEVRLDGSVFIAFHGYDEDGDLILDGVSGEKLSRFDVGHLQEILGAVEMKQGRSIDVSDQLHKQEEIHNSIKEQNKKDMDAVYQQEESRKQSYAQKTEEVLKAVLRPGMGLEVYAFEPVEFMKPSSLGDPVGQVVRRGDPFEYYVTLESAPMSLEVALAADSRHSIYKTAMLQRIADMLHEPGVDGRMDFDGSVTAGSVGDYVSHEIRHIDLISGNDTEDGKDLVRFWNDAQKVCDASNYCFSDDGYEALVAAMEAKLREARGEQASVQEGAHPVYADEQEEHLMRYLDEHYDGEIRFQHPLTYEDVDGKPFRVVGVQSHLDGEGGRYFSAILDDGTDQDIHSFGYYDDLHRAVLLERLTAAVGNGHKLGFSEYVKLNHLTEAFSEVQVEKISVRESGSISILYGYWDNDYFVEDVFEGPSLETLSVDDLERLTSSAQEKAADIRELDNQDRFADLATDYCGGHKAEFEKLSRSIPVSGILHHHDDLFQVEAMLFGQAGLLEHEFSRREREIIGGDYYPKLRNEYLYLAHKFSMHPLDGKVFENLNQKDVYSVCQHIARLAYAVSQGAITDSAVRPMEVSEYWKSHDSFGFDYDPAEELRKRLDKILAKDGDFIDFPTGERILKSPDGDDYIIFEDVEESVHSSLGELSENIKAGDQQGTAAAAFVDGALDGIIDEKYELKHKYNVRGNAVQGLDGYSEEDILKIVEDYYDENAGYDTNYQPRIVQMTVVGSRTRGEARVGSDLDVLVEYMDFGNSDTREESLFNALNDSENRLEIEGVKVDINSISPHFSRTTAEWLERDSQWRKEDQAKALDLPKGVLLGNDAHLLESMRSNPKDSHAYKAAMDEYDHSFAEEYVEYNMSYSRRLEGKTLEEVEQRLEALKAFYNDGGDLSDSRRVIQAAIQATEDRAMQLRE